LEKSNHTAPPTGGRDCVPPRVGVEKIYGKKKGRREGTTPFSRQKKKGEVLGEKMSYGDPLRTRLTSKRHTRGKTSCARSRREEKERDGKKVVALKGGNCLACKPPTKMYNIPKG